MIERVFAIKVEAPSDDVKGMRRKSVLDGVEKERRLRIVTAVYRGKAVADPGDAALAVAHAQALTHGSSSRWRWLSRVAAAAVVLYLAIELVSALIRRSRYEMPTSATIVLFLSARDWRLNGLILAIFAPIGPQT